MLLGNKSSSTTRYSAPCDISDTAVYILGISHVILSFIVIFGNLLVVLVVWKNKTMRNTTNLFLVNISSSDLSYALFTLPGLLFLILTSNTPFRNFERFQFVQAVRLAMVTPNGISSTVSTVTLAILAVERYNALIHPMKVRRRMSKQSAKISICVIWLFSVILFIPLFVQFAHYRSFDIPYYIKVVFIMHITIPTSIVIFCYGKIIIGIHVVKNICAQGNGTPQDVKDKKNLLKMLILTTLAFLIPKCIVLACSIIFNISQESRTSLKYSRLWSIVNLIERIQSPIIYVVYNQNYREGMKKLLRHFWTQGRTRQVGVEATQHQSTSL